jgi:glycerophosphoryl diester phosphodiesterase
LPGAKLIQPKSPHKETPAFWRVGHRGFPFVAPENTAASFEAAIRAGVDMIEFDVALSRDGIPVVLHDRTLERTTDGKGSPSRWTLAELKGLDAGIWFSRKFEGERIPTLDEVLRLALGKVAVNVEIKMEALSWRLRGGIEEKVISALRKSGMTPYSVVSSFLPLAVKRVKKISPEQSAALLLSKPLKQSPASVIGRLGVDAIHLPIQGLEPSLVAAARREGIPLRVFTVNRLPDMKRMRSWGVNGIFSDRADRLARL